MSDTFLYSGRTLGPLRMLHAVRQGDQAMWYPRTVAALVMLPLLVATATAQTSGVPEARLKAIYAMTPQQMAETGQWTKQAYDRMLGYINNIQDKDIRELVVDMV